MAEDGPKIHIDSDWKAQAQAEKQRLREREEALREHPAAAQRGAWAPSGREPIDDHALQLLADDGAAA